MIKLFDKIYRWFFHRSFSLKKRDALFLKQRLVRGWDDSETFSLDYSLAKVILPRLKRFAKVQSGHPYDMTSEEWNSIIQKMIDAFEFASSKERWSANSEELEKHQEGIDLFAKYYFSLWW